MDVLQYLREVTRTQHEAIEARVNLLRSDLSVNEYRSLLERFYGFYAPLEAALDTAADWDQLGFPFQERRKTGLLARDLRHLGLTERQLMALPRCASLPEVASPAAVLGCLYVIEGATLGGQVIARHVVPLLGITPEAGCGFFTSRGTDVGRNWRAFVSFLRAQLPGDAEARLAGHAACNTFSKLEAWLAGGVVAA